MKDEQTRKEWPETLNISELADRHDLRIVVEPRALPIEVETDCKIRRDDAVHRLRKDWLLFRTGVFAWVIVGLLCIGVVVMAQPGSDRNWALATLTAMITALLGYLSGRRHSPL
jgi:hypothetical protein